MTRALLSVVILGMLAMPLASDVNCEKAYLTFMEDTGLSDVDGDRLAFLHRAALRIFNACDSGHLQNPEAHLRKLEKSSVSDRWPSSHWSEIGSRCCESLP